MSGDGCKVKICGLTRIDDCDAVNIAQPEFAGFVFAPSRRRIDTQTAAALRKRLNPDIKTVGVFVNEDINVIAGIYSEGLIDLIQLHGDENDSYIINLRKKISPTRTNAATSPLIIKSVSIGENLPDLLPQEPDYLLFDTLSSVRGGSGKVFDWGLLKDFSGRDYFLSGGLSLDNISQALLTLSPFCADVSSGVETGGVKDSEKIKAFVQAVRNAERVI